jgi:uncharacterized protein YprB with RNaseH-like and TPR domain
VNLNEQDFLRLSESANTICFFDLESTGFKGDYNSIIVGSITPYQNKRSNSYSITQVGNDKKVVRELKEELESYDCWVTYYGKGFDLPMLNTRLLKWGYPPVDKRPHLDLYFTLKHQLNTSRKSLGHLVSWLNLPNQEEKMGVSADTWNQIAVDFNKNIKILISRCESDTFILRNLYEKTKHLIREIKR